MIILGVAVAAAGGAGYVAKNMVATTPPEVVVESGPQQPAVNLSDVLVLDGDVPMGQPLGDLLKWQSWPTDATNADLHHPRDRPRSRRQAQGFDRTRAALCRRAAAPLEADRRGPELHVVGPAVGQARDRHPDLGRHLGRRLHPSERLCRRDHDAPRDAGHGGGEGFITETILKNIRVLAIDQTIQEDEEGKKVKVGETATLELTPQQAEIITVAQQMADRLTLALRSITDTQEKPSDEADYLVSGNGRRGTVRLIKSGEVSEVGARK